MRDPSLFFLFSAVTRIKGVGGATAQALTRLLPPATLVSGATQPLVRDLLFHLPVSIVDRRFTCPLREAPDGVVATFVVTVDEHLPPKRRGKSPYKVLCSNDTGDITLVFFHAREDYLKQTLPVGQRRVISGRVEHFDHAAQMPHPDIIAPVEQLAEVQRQEPVYPLTVGLTSRRISKIVNDALEKLPEMPEWQAAPAGMTWKSALRQAHHPQSEDDLSPLSPARARLAYDEILASQLHLAMLRSRMQRQAGTAIKGTGAMSGPLLKSLPYTLTAGQEKALAEIGADMQSGHRMTRLLQGDVGSGKTVVALLAMLRAAEQGLQSALMAPTELIAQQHYETLSSLLETSNQQPATLSLLTGSVKGRAREEALAAIASGAAKIVVGTHALFQEHVEFKNLALAVVDEQHRFGVEQRMALSNKGDAPHLLHMTATPIPRSLAMTLYGDMDISQLREKPAGRQPITTRLIPAGRIGEVMERLKAALDRGEKAYWICPMIDGAQGIGGSGDGGMYASSRIPESPIPRSPDNDLAAAKTRFAEFRARFGPVVGLVHGRMKAEARDEEMRKFAAGETKLLVATTVVEVGVDVRDATIMVIEQAERFGLSQLHQLRGRVGRGDKPSACVLLYGESGNQGIRGSGQDFSSPNPLTPDSPFPRLSILRETDDGFAIAESDLASRGGGDLLGTRQHGLPRFIFTDLFAHQALLEQARDEAREILKSDPGLATPRGAALRLLLQLFGYEHDDIA